MKRFKNILCVVEPEENSDPALERAVTLAENNQASLTVVGVIESMTSSIGMPEGGPITADLQTMMERECEQRLQHLAKPYRRRLEIQTKVLKGIPFLEITREVLGNKRDLVIKIPETWDWLDRFFGSDDMHLLRKCPCPVWLIKAGATKPYRRVLAAVDVSEGYPPAEVSARARLNTQILEMAGALALSEFAELHVVCAWAAIGESALRGAFIRKSEEEITDYVEQIRRRYKQHLDMLIREVGKSLEQDALEYLKPQTHLVKGWARREIPVFAKQIDADVIVMGTVGRTGVPGFIMGNTAEAILNQIDCSVLAIKPPGFVSPVTVED